MMRRVAHAGLVIAFVVCGVVGGGIHFRHNKLLKQMAGVRQAVLQQTAPGDLLFCNTQIGKLLPPGWGNRTVLLTAFDPQADANLIAQKLGAARQTGASPARLELGHSNMAAQKPGRVFLAFWVRPGREDDASDAARVRGLVKALGAGYRLRPVASDLPEGVTIAQIEPETAGKATVGGNESGNGI